MPAGSDNPAPRHSLRRQLWWVIGLLLTVFAGSLGYTFWQLELRKHDYLILNLTGQLRVNQRLMLDQARHYLEQAPDDYDKYGRDLGLYWQDLQQQMGLAEQVVAALRERRLDPVLTGRDEAIQCTWDERSRSQMAHTANDWANFRSGLEVALGNDADGPRLTAAAAYIAAHGEDMAASVDRLALAFQLMMEGKLDLIRYFQIAAGVVAVLLLGLIAVAADRRVLRPLQETVIGFQRVARGALGHQLPAPADNEIGRMTAAFNALSSRLQALFRLTDRINQGTRLDQMLSFVLEEFRGFVPVDWVGVLFDETGRTMRIERMAGQPTPGLREGESLAATSNALATVARERRPLVIADLTAFGAAHEDADFARRLAAAGLGSALYLPLTGERSGFGVMVFAARARAAYSAEHAEFLGNIAGQVGHILEKTVVTEGLVVAAVEGLAKLAESRDPETGDHLLRMARYSAIVAEELGREAPYRERIDAAYVREVLRFAPMHDIGKVGIADGILLKPGRLDAAERSEMERHPAIGGEVLRRCEAQMNALGHSIFGIGIEIAECHHEKYDGSGYPAGLAGEAIPLSARIVAVADVFDALTSRRPYKEAWPVDKALAMLDEQVGRHFDPAVIAAFRRALPRVMEVYERFRHV
ncbi:MAG: HD domain-containing phosphohydrolase [Ectothiorhodospiraceae bacterium]|jgi:HD-GYP domain-containing protein (c-di-GMP phosphodiesterase class II)/HAMP domain-containing protein|nr:HD domain-containing phosphohydrolase [Ectothiorhodospiraceae bacterium]